MLTAGTFKVTLLNPLHPKNCDKVIPPEEVREVEIGCFRPAGIVIPFKLSQEAKAPGPKVVTLSGIVSSLSRLQPLNA